ncbi:initiation factor 2B [Salinilacihabitans rarus]|uniref:initiation factor 2B n=1 Tax=Salinilacihabitans rarus TaxID=2961596 RepID=UPI0020C89784|nr:initiation factor 2B [Salinilacihabitans rarus]
MEANASHGGDDADHVVTAFLRNGGEVLLLRRGDAVGTYVGAWGGVSGFAEGRPDEQVRVEIAEETGLADEVSLVRSSRPLSVSDPDRGREWVVHPYLFDCASREVELSEEHDACEWTSPTAILDADRETVPALWETYERVAPSVRSIAADDAHGAAWLSLRALETLRDRSGVIVAESEAASSPRTGERGTRKPDADPAEEWDELAALARRLLEVRPSMAVLRNRVNRAMAGAVERAAEDGDPDATAVLESTLDGIDRALAADEGTAARAADRVEGRVATLSRSGTVLEALRRGDPDRVFVAESRPGREGVDVAEELAEACPVTLHADAAAATVLAREDVDRVVVGADSIRPDGAVVNKTGTRGAAIAAAREGVPVTVVAASDKVSTREEVNLESGDRAAVYDGAASVDVANPTFDVTPADCVTEVVTERGTYAPAEVREVAAELRDRERWQDR